MISINQIIYKTNNQGKLFQYEVINIDFCLNTVTIKSFSSGYTRKVKMSEILSYSQSLPNFNSIAKVASIEIKGLAH